MISKKNRVTFGFNLTSGSILVFSAALLLTGIVAVLFISQIYAANSTSTVSTVVNSTSTVSTVSTVVNVFPADGYKNFRAPAHISARFSEPLESSTVTESTFTVEDSSGNKVPGVVTMVLGSGKYDPRFAMFKPQTLKGNETYTVKLDGFKDIAGNNVAPYEWSFTLTDPSKVIMKKGDASQGAPPPPAVFNKFVKVHLDSITVREDHDGFGLRPSTCCSGEWSLIAFIQGEPVHLLADNSVDAHDPDNTIGYNTIEFPEDNEFTVPMAESLNLPLSIFTYGIESDVGITTHFPAGFCATALEHKFEGSEADKWKAAWKDRVGYIFYAPTAAWPDKIENYQIKETLCPDTNKLGFINEIYAPPGLGAGEHTVVSSNGDFTLKYTITVEPQK